MDWETQYRSWLAATQDNHDSDLPERLILRATRKACHEGGPLDTDEAWSWVENSLRDPKRKWFVAHVFNSRAAPKRLGTRFLEMAVHELNPSANRCFVEPAVYALGAEAIYEALLKYLKSGSPAEKAGAASAFYWVRHDHNNPSQIRAASTLYDEMLVSFVEDEDVDVRRRILPLLSMNPDRYSERVRHLVPRVIEVARNHSDEYIRHRIEVQLGSGKLFRPIPRWRSFLGAFTRR